MVNFERTARVPLLQIVQILLVASVTCIAQSGFAQTYTVIHKFTGGSDGASPYAGLTMDAAGNFYGTTVAGGFQGSDDCRVGNGCGTVFKLARRGTGWGVEPLYQFLGGSDGIGPLSRVVFGPDGALYGTTQAGGSNGCIGGSGCGTVFRLTPPSRRCTRVFCQWNETVLHAFTGGIDGELPEYGDLTFDAAGNMFGTTGLGGVHDQGTLFKLSRQNGVWMESVPRVFGGADAKYPSTGVTFDAAGNILGTANGGDPYYHGLVYELQPIPGGWSESTIFTFTIGSDGASPAGGLIKDASGNMYGTTTSGGPSTNGGTVFELTPSGSGWTLTTLSGIVGGSGGPHANLTMDAHGTLYGTTDSDGVYGYGSVFKLVPQSDGTWTFYDLYDFTGFDDGREPDGSVAIDSNGNLWGTTSLGGDRTRCFHIGCGVIWEITP